jgi:hypothetical protein
LNDLGLFDESYNSISDYYENGEAQYTCEGLVSVIYVECETLSVAWGSAMGYVATVQLVLIAACFILYRVFLHDPNSTRAERLTAGVRESIAIAQEKLASK